MQDHDLELVMAAYRFGAHAFLMRPLARREICGLMSRLEAIKMDGCSGGDAEGLLTRRELAQALRVSLRTVDQMLADEEITPVRLRDHRNHAVAPPAPIVARRMVAKRVGARMGTLADFFPRCTTVYRLP